MVHREKGKWVATVYMGLWTGQDKKLVEDTLIAMPAHYCYTVYDHARDDLVEMKLLLFQLL